MMVVDEPGRWNWEIRRGRKLDKILTYKDPDGALVDLTGYTAKLQIRQKIADDAVLLEFSTDDGSIILGDEAGTIQLVKTADEIGDVDWETSAVHELVLYPADVTDDAFTLLVGYVWMVDPVTR